MIKFEYSTDYLSNEYNNLTFYIKKDIKYLMQLGTNSGKDIFNNICVYMNDANIILVEANKIHNQNIINNYDEIKNKNNIFIINKAIVLSSYNKDTIEFYNYENNEQSSIIKNGSTVQNINYEILEVGTIKFNDILDSFNFYNLELLMIDLEGLDYELLMDINFELVPNLKYIFFEGYHIDEKYNTIINNEKIAMPVFGKKFKKLIDKLIYNNYVIKIISPNFYDLLFEKEDVNKDNYHNYLVETNTINYYSNNNSNNSNNNNSNNKIVNYIFLQIIKLKSYYNHKLISKYTI